MKFLCSPAISFPFINKNPFFFLRIHGFNVFYYGTQNKDSKTLSENKTINFYEAAANKLRNKKIIYPIIKPNDNYHGPLSKNGKVGVVVGTKMQKTAKVAVERFIMHPKYQREYRRTTKYFCHDEYEECVVGDVVSFVPDIRRNKTKCHRIESIIKPIPRGTFNGKLITTFD